jgi:hypothetical protein
MEAYVWIGHQRFPTRGRVWHPGGAHPFSGLDEALVHNGDFANYFGVTEYLRQRNYFPLFMTDTEVAVYLFDLYNRVYGYPLEYVIEALAPTTERDFTKLPIEAAHLPCDPAISSCTPRPTGRGFFIVARNDVRSGALQLIGITDTSMLRPRCLPASRRTLDWGDRVREAGHRRFAATSRRTIRGDTGPTNTGTRAAAVTVTAARLSTR